jgi:sulfate permease, SulP family
MRLHQTSTCRRRSSVNNEVGARTPLAQLVCGLLVMFVLLFLTPVFKFMPYNCLAAVIIIGVSSLVELETPIHFFKVSALEQQPACCPLASRLGGTSP